MTLHRSLRPILRSALFVVPMLASGEIAGPYLPGADTAYLWHFDEPAGATAAASAVAGRNNLIAVDGSPTANPLPLNAGIMGSSGPLGFGNSAIFSAADLGLGYDGNGSGDFNPDIITAAGGADVISTASFMGANGAFTLEALVNLSSLTSTASREIISMDRTGLNSVRPFQFVVTAGGSLRFREFANNVTFELAIPTAGPDAFQPNTWFHAAYSYDGEGTGTLYWTLMDPSRTQASLLSTVTGLNDMPVNSAPLVIGNENRDVFGEGVLGMVDEVRISSVAYGAGDFLFVPEPTSALLAVVGAMLLGCTRRTRETERMLGRGESTPVA